MSMSDCAKCWNTPCVCGYGYRGWSVRQIDSQIAMLQRVRANRALELNGVKLTDPLFAAEKEWRSWRAEDEARDNA